MTALATPSRRPGTRRTPITEPGDPTMTMTTLRPNSPAVTSTWNSSVVALPAERRAATPFHTRESFYQVTNSQLWHAMEGAVGVAHPT
ncbi:hypothetical protein [Streptomyces mirabilis]|uniref:hypothetical protein n=2 Tax=Streptomyces mirabilis TaxID=68239 RepID=UPI00324B40D3